MSAINYIRIIFVIYRKEIKEEIIGGRNQLVELTHKIRNNCENQELLLFIYGDDFEKERFIKEYSEILDILETKIENNDYSQLNGNNQENKIINEIIEYFKDEEYSINRDGSPIDMAYKKLGQK
jgi:hypothetical protein